MSEWICVDFETTGLLNGATTDPLKQPGIVQIGIVEVESDGNGWMALRPYYQTLIDPEMPIEPGASAAHGITAEKLVGAPKLCDVFGKLQRRFLGKTRWIGFNSDFDKQVLFYQLQRYNLSTEFPWPTRTLDVMKAATDYCNLPGKSGNKYPKLIELHQHLFGKGFEGAHDALADVLATIECGGELVRRGVI